LGYAFSDMMFFLALLTLAQHDDHHKAEHHKMVDRRGDAVMGFSHEKTVHRFVDAKDGGFIEAAVKDESDAAQLAAIRKHFKLIAQRFAEGDFSMPMAIHGRLPDGAAEMKAGGKRVQYRYEEMEKGARVRVSRADAKLAPAVHRFLAFQRADHRAH
jgi:hypothetical protein